MGERGEVSGGEGGGNWVERGRELGMGYPPVHPLRHSHFQQEKKSISIYVFVLILCMFTMYVCYISFVFIE